MNKGSVTIDLQVFEDGSVLVSKKDWAKLIRWLKRDGKITAKINTRRKTRKGKKAGAS